MSLVKIQGNASGTGTLTIAAPNTNTDRTLTLPDQTATLITNSADVLNIGSGQVYKDASGNVGIGTSSPSVKLQVQGSAGSNPEIRCLDGTVNSQWYAGSDGTCVFGTYSNHPIVWRTNGSERARIDSSGNLLVGTTSSKSTRVASYASGRAGYFFTTQAANGQDVCNIGNANGGYSFNAFRFWNGELDAGSVIGTIACTTTATAYNTSSDYRLKEAIAPMTGALATVAALKPVTYKWKADGSDGQGFIAHELQAVVPDCVTGEKDAVDAEGNPQYQGIDTSFLTATLTAAIQELKAIVDAQGAEIAALKGTA